MSPAVRIGPCPAISSTIRPPGSKSITNRALVCAALAEGDSHLTGVLDSEDTLVMIEAWRSLGVDIAHDNQTHVARVSGTGGKLANRQANLFVANSGTTIRFLTAALAACHGEFVLDGVPRMRERPIGDLLTALRQIGGNCESRNALHADCPPVALHSQGLAGGESRISGSISSQFLSGLMMAAPMAASDVRLIVEGELVSVPYVEMTAAVMRSFGAKLECEAQRQFHINASAKYQGTRYDIEPDASAASYFWASAAICGGTATVQGLSRSSLQGDVRFCEVLQKMGCTVDYQDDSISVSSGERLVGVDVDMSDISDTVQTLAAVALYAQGSTTVRGVAHNRVKETDRISDLARELKKFGGQVDEFDDGLTIHPPEVVLPATIKTYSDHRMAMSLALVGLRTAGIVIQDPDCTAKTYPKYWEEMGLFSGSRIGRLD